MCLGHDSRVSGGALVVLAVDGLLQEVCSAKFRRSGENIGQLWRLPIGCHESGLCPQHRRWMPLRYKMFESWVWAGHGL